jgi:hypothetical protein
MPFPPCSFSSLFVLHDVSMLYFLFVCASACCTSKDPAAAVVSCRCTRYLGHLGGVLRCAQMGLIAFVLLVSSVRFCYALLLFQPSMLYFCSRLHTFVTWGILVVFCVALRWGYCFCFICQLCPIFVSANDIPLCAVSPWLHVRGWREPGSPG